MITNSLFAYSFITFVQPKINSESKDESVDGSVDVEEKYYRGNILTNPTKKGVEAAIVRVYKAYFGFSRTLTNEERENIIIAKHRNHEFTLKVLGYNGRYDDINCELSVGNERICIIGIDIINLMEITSNHTMVNGICYDKRRSEQKTKFTLVKHNEQAMLLSKNMPSYKNIIFDNKKVLADEYQIGKVYTNTQIKSMYTGEFAQPISFKNQTIEFNDRKHVKVMMKSDPYSIVDDSVKSSRYLKRKRTNTINNVKASEVIQSLIKRVDDYCAVDDEDNTDGNINYHPLYIRNSLLGSFSIIGELFGSHSKTMTRKPRAIELNEAWMDVDIDWYEQIDNLMDCYRQKVLSVLPVVMNRIAYGASMRAYMEVLPQIMMRSRERMKQGLSNVDKQILRITLKMIENNNNETKKKQQANGTLYKSFELDSSIISIGNNLTNVITNIEN